MTASLNLNQYNHNTVEYLFSYVVETYRNDWSWYRLYSDGWIEQGDRAGGTGAQVIFLKPMASTRYFIAFSSDVSGWSTYNHSCGEYDVTKEGFYVRMIENNKTSSGMNAVWMVCGETADFRGYDESSTPYG